MEHHLNEAMRNRNGWGTAFAKKLENEGKGAGVDPLGGQLDCFYTQHYHFAWTEPIFIGSTIRCDIPLPGVFIVSACRRTWLTRWLEKYTRRLTWLGRRELIAIHVRRAG